MSVEKSCPERTFKCPHNNCGSIMKLEDFDEHALKTPGSAIDSHSVFGDSDMRLPISVKENRLKPVHVKVFASVEDITENWGRFKNLQTLYTPLKKRQMHCIRAHGELFHVRLDYYKPKNCFVLSILTAKCELGASKFRANVKIDCQDEGTSMKSLLITSVENVPLIDNCMAENGKHFWCIPFDLAMNNSVMTRKPNSTSIFHELRGNVRVIKLPDARRLCITPRFVKEEKRFDHFFQSRQRL